MRLHPPPSPSFCLLSPPLFAPPPASSSPPRGTSPLIGPYGQCPWTLPPNRPCPGHWRLQLRILTDLGRWNCHRRPLFVRVSPGRRNYRRRSLFVCTDVWCSICTGHGCRCRRLHPLLCPASLAVTHPYATVNIKAHILMTLTMKNPTYTKWSSFLKTMCGEFGLRSHNNSTMDSRSEHPDWDRVDCYVRSWIFGSVDDSILGLAMEDESLLPGSSGLPSSGSSAPISNPGLSSSATSSTP